MDGVKIDYLGGNCPVQAEGDVDGHSFYFRSRGSRWTLEIARAPDAPLEYLLSPETKNWFYQEPWGEGPYDAGWMPEEVAMEMLEKGITSWRRHRSRCEPNRQ